MQTSLEKILKAGKPPQASYQLHDEAMKHLMTLQHLKGDKGDTPQFGTDYFTPEHVQILEDHLRTRLKGQDGMSGLDGRHGRDGRNGVDGKDGKDGKDADPMVLYSVLEQKMSEMMAGYALQEDAEDKLNSEEVLSTRKLIDFLKRGGFRGGGSGGATYLSSLLDVALATPTIGQVLAWSGTAWINQTLSVGATKFITVQNLSIGTTTITHTLGSIPAIIQCRLSTGEDASFYILNITATTFDISTPIAFTNVRISAV